MKKIHQNINTFLDAMDGVFRTDKNKEIPKEILDLYLDIMNNVEMSKLSEDKMNLNRDLYRIYEDTQKALIEYKKIHNVSKAT